MKTTKDGNDLFQRKLARRARMLTKLRVLVVDDEASILELLKTALAALDNYDVSIASSAADALKILKRQDKPFDCLLLDIQMPDVNGIQLLQKIRRLPEYAETPVIMLTAMSDRKYVDEAFFAGATDYVTKPFDLLELRSRMTSVRRLVQERSKALKSLETAAQLKNELQYNQQFSCDDPITIEDVDRFLRYVEFDNYIGQLSRGRLFNSFATAIKLQDAEFFFDMASSGDFRHVLQDIASGIEKTTKDADCIMSYRGNGVFLAISHGRSQLQQFPSEEKLNRMIATLLGMRRTTPWVHVLIGDAVPLRSLSRAGATTALSKAVENVETRELALRKDLDTDAAQYNVSADTGNSPSRRRVYERVLRELFGEEAHLQG